MAIRVFFEKLARIENPIAFFKKGSSGEKILIEILSRKNA
jgi:hypothetical protein